MRDLSKTNNRTFRSALSTAEWRICLFNWINAKIFLLIQSQCTWSSTSQRHACRVAGFMFLLLFIWFLSMSSASKQNKSHVKIKMKTTKKDTALLLNGSVCCDSQAFTTNEGQSSSQWMQITRSDSNKWLIVWNICEFYTLLWRWRSILSDKECEMERFSVEINNF